MIHDLIDALNQLNDATKAYEKARDACEHNGGYFLHDEENDVADAKMNFEDKLNAIIDNRVNKRLRQLRLAP